MCSCFDSWKIQVAENRASEGKSTPSSVIPVTVQYLPFRGSHRSDSAQLGVNLLVGVLQGTPHFHFAHVKIGQNKEAGICYMSSNGLYMCLTGGTV